MITLAEQIKVMQAALAGKPIEVRLVGSTVWAENWVRKEMETCSKHYHGSCTHARQAMVELRAALDMPEDK